MFSESTALCSLSYLIETPSFLGHNNPLDDQNKDVVVSETNREIEEQEEADRGTRRDTHKQRSMLSKEVLWARRWCHCCRLA